MLLKARDWVGVEATDRLRERGRIIEAWRKDRLPSVEELVQFMGGPNSELKVISDQELGEFMGRLNSGLPVINVPADVAEFNKVWQAFMEANNHFSLSDIRHVTRNYGRENEAYELRICLDLAKLPQGASENVQNIARQIIEAQSNAIKEEKEYTQLHLEGLNALQFTHIPQLQIEDNKISLVTTFSPTSHFSTKQHFNYATQIMAVLNKALEDQTISTV